MLRSADGLSIIETLRGEGNLTAALAISALSSVDERINGLKAGGDDYLTKPFYIRELTARVDALLRHGRDARRHATAGRGAGDGSRRPDRPVRRKASRSAAAGVHPAGIFHAPPGQIVTRAMLLEDVWNFKFMAETNVVDVQIGNLRRKLDPAGARRFIVNIRAVGFKLNADL